MTVKEGVLLALENNRGSFVSGEALSAQLGVSRQYISKTVKTLVAEGYDIAASTNKGYILSEKCDLLSAAVIKGEAGGNVYCFDRVDSTNRVAKEIYCREGECLVVSERQTAGVKKDGSRFISPQAAGIYMTAALPLDIPLEEIKSYRQSCGLQVKLAIEAACGEMAEVRDTDDVYVNGEKVCGILVECMVNAAALKTECVFVGVGVYTGEAEGVSAHISGRESRNKLAADIFKRLKGIAG
ncbi:MAG: HTH domain-containing protein [Clostridia bacterium]|nr:HTH domain-containing protein [Clostridia bacterium]